VGIAAWIGVAAVLQSLPVRVIAEVMGCSGSHGSKVRRGLLVPHRRHWKALARVSRL
jgi:hypothetical protein